MRTQEVTLTANEPRLVSLNGNFFTLLASTYAVDMQFITVDGGQNDISKGIEAGYSEQFTERLTAVIFTSQQNQVVKYGYALGVVSFDRAVTDTRVKQPRTRLGTMQSMLVQTPQIWDESENENLVGFYVKAAAANTETVLITNKDAAPSHYYYWPDSLKVAPGTTTYFAHTGEQIEFALEVGALDQLIKIVPVYRV
jgi:hypothetical protein